MPRKLIPIGAALVLAFAGTSWAASKSQKADVTLYQPMLVAGKTLPAGDYRFAWTGTGDQVDVMVEQGKKTVTEAKAKLEYRDKPYDQEAVVSRKDSSGRQALEELELRGKPTALVFVVS